MKKIDISIIIPLYKGEKFCNRLLKLIEKNCLYKNLYKSCFVEIIFVNDYPSEKIEIKNDNAIFDIQIIIHKKNQGIHGARVTGIKNARGQFIIMFDQDDLARDNWLYNQWNSIQENQSEICICNGWNGRFHLLTSSDELEQRIENHHDFVAKGNPIMSPGQVIIKKKCIPIEWIDNILKNNGADDYLLWIMMLKKGYRFAVNRECLYYHSPERTKDSVDDLYMIKSLKEVVQILSESGPFLSKQEIDDFNEYIKFRENCEISAQNHKDTKILQIMKTWLDLKNQGASISEFFDKYQYNRIVVYGFGCIGESLYYELCNSKVNIDYVLDMNYCLKDFKDELSILGWKDELWDVDAVIVTLVSNYNDVIERLRKIFTCPIFTMYELLLDIQSDWMLNIVEK